METLGEESMTYYTAPNCEIRLGVSFLCDALNNQRHLTARCCFRGCLLKRVTLSHTRSCRLNQPSGGDQAFATYDVCAYCHIYRSFSPFSSKADSDSVSGFFCHAGGATATYNNPVDDGEAYCGPGHSVAGGDRKAFF